MINVCCDRALLGAYTRETRKVTPALVRRAAGEVYGRRFSPLWLGWVAAAIILAGVTATVFAGWHAWQQPNIRVAQRSEDGACADTARVPAAAAPAAPRRAAGFDQCRARGQCREYE